MPGRLKRFVIRGCEICDHYSYTGFTVQRYLFGAQRMSHSDKLYINFLYGHIEFPVTIRIVTVHNGTHLRKQCGDNTQNFSKNINVYLFLQKKDSQACCELAVSVLK